MGYFSAHPAVFIENGCLFQGKRWSLSQQPLEPLSYQKLCVHKVFEAIPTAKRPGIVSCGSDVITFVMSGTHPGSKHWKGRWKLAVALPFSDFFRSLFEKHTNNADSAVLTRRSKGGGGLLGLRRAVATSETTGKWSQVSRNLNHRVIWLGSEGRLRTSRNSKKTEISGC